ncbi:PQQ-binding-like beta-propeller repeat protein [Limnoglobus roseus]|uniref:Serine/threonine protein kinase n=1 Tax=Limnoglobus roseus TaxID=2598579 RepID=A0A5C1AP96_9BACT|nr:PQQ-binding-like beta-propeller repeat protein [Limnoglobus roseus]QEL18688.1 serine/threonine protein kinase [Limnoglobus roseus]
MLRLLLSILASIVLIPPTLSADWPEFRGPNGAGQYDGPKLVTEWGPDKNVAWKTPIPGKGWSSPIVVKGKVYLSTAVPKDGGQSLHAICMDAGSGSVDWDQEVIFADAKTAGRAHAKNSYSSATPASDGTHVFVHFAHMGTACLDLKGTVVWKRTDYQYNAVHGTGGSPILVDDLVVFSADGGDQQFVAALDKATGDERWKTDRKSTASKRFSFSTPQLITANDRRVIVSGASDFIAAYDPKDGKEVWRTKYPAGGYSIAGRPILAGGRVVVQTSFDTPYLLALDTSDSPAKVAWSSKKGAPHTPTPVAFGDEVYTVTDQGFLTCLDAKTGTVHWTERLPGKGYSSSPIIANGLIYTTSEDGVGQVVEATKVGFKSVGQSALKEKTFATFAPVDGSLYVRTESQLYRFVGK